MQEKIEKELEKVGLSEKEARVYLAGLELGPASAQMLAAKSGINRPSTYILIELLIKRGLMSSFIKGKKKYFSSGKPTQLLYILNNKKREFEESVKKLESIFNYLNDLNSHEAPIAVYEGTEAINATQQELLQNKDEVRELVPIDLVRDFIPPIYQGDVRESFSKKFHIKSLYSTRTGPLHRKKLNVEYRYLPPEKFPFSAQVLIFGQKVVISTYDKRPAAIHISDKNIVDTMKILFDALWSLGTAS